MLSAKENEVGSTNISTYSYGVNGIGQRTQVSKTGTAFGSTRDITWGYDAKGQVTKADSTISGLDRAYQYDLIGNRLKSADSLTLPGTNNYTPNALNQYTAINSLTPTHDSDGNMTSGPLPANLSANSTLVWDGENRLVQAQVSGGNTVTYQYDALSRRIVESVGSSTTVTVYDGWNPIAEYGASYALAKTYVWGTDLSGSMQEAGGVGGLLSVTDSTGSYYPTYDGNGNVSEYLDSTGAIVAHYEYDPFGRTTVATGTKANDFAHRFSTKPLDGTTGLYYYGYRFYDPETGRWPSRDPIQERGGVNLYGFVGNNAVNSWDLLGYYTLNPDNYNGPTGADLAKLVASLSRVQKKAEDLMVAIDDLNQCLAKERPDSQPAIDKLLDLKQTFRKIAAGIRGSKEIEVEQDDLGSGTQAQMVTYSGLADPVLELNINPSNNWTSLANNVLDSLLMHEVSHEAADTEDNGTLDANDAHFIDGLDVKLCGDSVIRSWMTKKVRDCCCPKP